MLKLKLEYFGHLMQRTDTSEKMSFQLSRKCTPSCWRVTSYATDKNTTWRSTNYCSRSSINNTFIFRECRYYFFHPGVGSIASFSYSINMIQFSSVNQSGPTLCNPIDCSMPCFPVQHQLPVCTNSWWSSWWCHSTISSYVIPFSCLQSFPA